MKADELRGYLEGIHANGRFDYENDQIKDTIIECMKRAGRREEDYVQTFKRIIARIKNGETGFPDHDRENGRQVNLYIDAKRNYNLALFFEPQKVKKWLKMTMRYKIYKIEIVDRDTLRKIFP